MLALAATVVSASAVAKAALTNGDGLSQNHARYMQLTSCAGGGGGGGDCGGSGGGDNGGSTGGTCSPG